MLAREEEAEADFVSETVSASLLSDHLMIRMSHRGCSIQLDEDNHLSRVPFSMMYILLGVSPWL